MFCMNCGQELPIQAKFCMNCGNKVETVPETPKDIGQNISVQKSIKESTSSNVQVGNNSVLIDENNNCVNVFGKQLSGKDPTTLYVEVVEIILKAYPQFVGQKETQFTTDKIKADSYTGKTRELFIAGSTVYVKTGFSTNVKWKNVKALCKLAGIECDLVQEQAKESTTIEKQKISKSTKTQKETSNLLQNMSNEKTKIDTIDKMEFKGKFDSNAALSRCYIDSIGSSCSCHDSLNYVEYNNHIYFLVYKDSMEEVKPKKILFDFNAVEKIIEKIEEVHKRVEYEKPEEEREILRKFNALYGEIQQDMPKLIVVEECKEFLRKFSHELLSKTKELVENILSDKCNTSLLEELEGYISEDVLNAVYTSAYNNSCNEIRYTYVVFGAIDLATYKVEILKEYQSNLWKGGALGYARKGPLISVSNNKIWYITYLWDDIEQYGSEHGNLAVKCLDITTKTESVVMELPKVTEARMPIVMGNIFTYMADGKLVCHNLETGAVNKKMCERILGYNDSHIFFSKNEYNSDLSSFFVLDVAKGEIIGIRNYIKEELGISDKIINLYYVDCRNRDIYVLVERKKKKAWRTDIEIWEAIISIKDKKIEYINTTNIGSYGFITNFDGRCNNVAFDGSLYIMHHKGNSNYVSNRIKGTEPYDDYLVRIDKDGTEHFTKCMPYPTDYNVIVPFGDKKVIAKLNYGQFFLYHNDEWHEIFRVNE